MDHIPCTKLSRALLAAALLPALPALAQTDFTGHWAPLYHEDHPERLPGPEMGDFMGIPINEAARMRGDTYDPDQISVVTEYQCRPHGSDYSMRGLAHLRIDPVFDPTTQRLIAFHTRMGWMEMERTVWLDGRPHPSALAPHTFPGFSTGVWEGNMLTITTTHLKPSYLRRNGLPRSDKATYTEHWMRHGNYLTVTTVIRDPVYLTEPLVRSQNWALDPAQRIGRDFCEYAHEVPSDVLVPHYLPGANPYLSEVADWYGLPYEAVRGGAETLYPEFRLKMTKPRNPVPAHCDRYCHCGNQGGGCDLR
jgi:hypothetical protein